MRLFMIRHAAAEPRSAGRDDRSRALTEDGGRRFEQAATGLARVFAAPAVILTSPLVRARQTAQIASSAWGDVTIEELEALAEGDADGIEASLARWGEDGCVAVVGHEPFMSEHLARLLSARRAEALEFKKGGVAVVDFNGAVATPGGGRLAAFLPPKLLRSTTPRE